MNIPLLTVENETQDVCPNTFTESHQRINEKLQLVIDRAMRSWISPWIRNDSVDNNSTSVHLWWSSRTDCSSISKTARIVANVRGLCTEYHAWLTLISFPVDFWLAWTISRRKPFSYTWGLLALIIVLFYYNGKCCYWVRKGVADKEIPRVTGNELRLAVSLSAANWSYYFSVIGFITQKCRLLSRSCHSQMYKAGI